MKKNILFLENNAFMRKLVYTIFKFQHKLTLCETIHEATKHIDKVKYDLIITDLNLEGENGIDFVNEIKKLDDELPVIILSGEIEQKIQCYLLGVEDFIAKPFLIKELDLRVNNILNRRDLLINKDYKN
ncbi:response regulator [Flammeovirga yaeyamensis]|uniref:Response regulator n=1 Tax=Flammeovirga yaeyamensis TaxID=367791 RepID=A0AAX1ND73_9BACT|nr:MULTISPECIES: response regulator [Flammeovirga]ANQ52098.2 response regulator [Flammeovirga sp. MY04]MBB3699235.1 DNA-binding response OmpR family regulator [Flammeovirga yaeyamensis]NMF35502.1 response regulator [Flammeovirga yaeyamensis]QWG04361.1 response regulator [Flammeovirga yaeyamensis]